MSLDGDGMILRRREGTYKNNAFSQTTAEKGRDAVFTYGSGQQLAEQTRDGTKLDVFGLMGMRDAGPAGKDQQKFINKQARKGNVMGAYDQIAQRYSVYGQDGATRVQVQSGDTLQGIAQRVYGNSSLWYVLAAANALSGDSELIAGTQLRVPEVGVSKNDASTFKPYNPNDIVGSTSPGLPYIPPASSNQCAVVAMVIVAIAVTVLTYGQAAPYLSSMLTPIATLGTMSGITTVGAITGGFVAGVAGSIASQLVGKALGAVDHFSLRSAVGNGIATAITMGVSAATAGLGTLGDMIKTSQWGHAAAVAVVNATSGYVGNKIAGVANTSFSWKEIASSAVTSVITASISNKLNFNSQKPLFGSGQFGQDFINDSIGGVVSLHTRRAFGFNDKVDYGSILTNAFGVATGNGLVRAMQGGSFSGKSSGSSDAKERADWRRDAEMRLRQVAYEEEIQRFGYAEPIYLDGNSTSVDRKIQSSDISLRSAIASLSPSDRTRLAEVAQYENVHLNPVTQKEEIYRSWVMSFRILEDSKLQPIPMASSLPVSLPFVSGYAARNASIESNRQSAVSQWNQSKIPGVRVTGRVFANAGYNIISGANSLGSILTDPAHAKNVVNSISFAVRNPGKVYDGVVNKIQDMSNRSWQENLETAAVFGTEALATAGTGFMIRRTDGALGLVDEVISTTGAPKYIYDAGVGRYREVTSGKFVAARNLPWPDNAGFLSSTKQIVPEGKILDRFGNTDGRFLGEPGSTLSARGMAQGSDGMPYRQYEVIKEFEARVGPAAPVPDFNAIGGATQYLQGKTIEQLVFEGYLREIRK